MDREKVIKRLEIQLDDLQKYADSDEILTLTQEQTKEIVALLKEQEKKEIKLHKKHVLTLKRNDEFTMRKLYESICEKLLDEGEMIITRTDDHEKVEFVFYVAGE